MADPPRTRKGKRRDRAWKTNDEFQLHVHVVFILRPRFSPPPPPYLYIIPDTPSPDPQSSSLSSLSTLLTCYTYLPSPSLTARYLLKNIVLLSPHPPSSARRSFSLASSSTSASPSSPFSFSTTSGCPFPPLSKISVACASVRGGSTRGRSAHHPSS